MTPLVIRLAAGVLVTSLTFSARAEGAEATASKHPGLRFIHVGNSHSNTLRYSYGLARAAGHPQHQDEEIYVLGAPLRWNWDHPEQNKWQQKLAADKAWDSLLLLCWGGDDDNYAAKFAGEAFQANPRCQVLLYTIWPDANVDMAKPPEIRSETHTEKVAEAVAKAFPNSLRPKVIPSSLLVREIGRLADRGEVPGMKSKFEVYTDGGHLSSIGAYAVNVMVVSMLYDESPLDYPDSIVRYDANGKPVMGVFNSIPMEPATAQVLRRIVWDILCTYPPAGMTPRLAIADRLLPAAVAGQVYRHQLALLHSQGSPRWSLAEGKLPDGFSLSASGIIAGQSGAVGEYPLVVRAESGSGTVQRALRLEIAADKPPMISAPDFASIALDTYVLKELKADGGVGAKSWSLAAGALPYGLRLSSGGVLYGTPGEAGEFVFTVRVEDSNPAGSRFAERAITLRIGPADARTLSVKKVPAKVVTVDGRLAEPFWRLDQPLAVVASGKPVKQATFGAVWEEQDRRQGQGQRLVLAVKVVDGTAGKSAKDGVHIYIDGRHNKEVIYNADDTHFFVPRDHKGGWAKSVRGKVNWFTDARVQEIEGGYTVEVSLSANYFTGEGNWLPFGVKGVYGFDVAVDEEAGRQAWRGNEKLDDDTSVFGSILLVNAPAQRESH
jgi:hypothetical protein